MDTAEISICPLANPDGVYYGGNQTVDEAIRYNINGIDLNRNYPDSGYGPHPDGDTIWEPETAAMMGFMKQHNFSLSANFHSGASLVNYPWDTWIQPHPDSAWFNFISKTICRYSAVLFSIRIFQ